MFKPVTAFILLIAFTAQTFASPFIMLDYFVNTAAYTKNCVNKAKPQMHCNGQCQLMKKILEQERKDQQNSQQKADSKVQVLSSGSFFSQVAVPSRSTIKVLYINSAGHPVDRSISLFHPPQL